MTITTAATVTLAHGSTLRLATWAYPYSNATAEVVTARGYATKNGEDAETAHARAAGFGHDTCWTYSSGGTLVDSKAYRDAMRAAEDAAFAASVVVEHGQLVEIEGVAYRVHVNHGNTRKPANSNPVSFRRVL